MKISIKYKNRTWDNLPIGRVRTVQSILDEFCPVTLFPSENIDTFVNGTYRAKNKALKGGDILEIKDRD